MKITKSTFGKITKYELANDNNMVVEVLDLGGVITKILVPDKHGVVENVVLAHRGLETFFENPAFLGAMIGRTAGRIGNAKFNLNGVEYKLHVNDNHNCLHGGINSFNSLIWDVEAIEEDGQVGIKLSYVSPDGENGYPGTFKVNVFYLLNNNNELTIKYNGVSDKDTLVNMTNHAYFNLSGDCKRNVLNQELFINADHICELDEFLIPSGEFLKVKDSPFDFTVPKTIGADVNKENAQLQYGSGYDHPWVLNKEKDVEITLYDEVSGRAMDIMTDQKVVVGYSMNFPNDLPLDCGKIAEKHDAVCLETQGLPVGYDDCFIESGILKAGEEYNNQSTYRFYTK